MTAKKKHETGFEQDLEKLEAIVEKLEEGGLPLEESLKQFEAGIQLTRKCEKALRQAEQKIEMLVRGMDDELEAQPFDADVAESEETTPAKKAAKPRSRSKSAPVPDDNDEPPEDAVEPPYDDDDDDMDVLF